MWPKITKWCYEAAEADLYWSMYTGPKGPTHVSKSDVTIVFFMLGDSKSASNGTF